MSQAPGDTRSVAEKALDTVGIIGSFRHEDYVPNAEDEAIHQRALRERERKARARKRPQLSYSIFAVRAAAVCSIDQRGFVTATLRSRL